MQLERTLIHGATANDDHFKSFRTKGGEIHTQYSAPITMKMQIQWMIEVIFSHAVGKSLDLLTELKLSVWKYRQCISFI